MNILFVNYGDFTTNSLNHISGFANLLCAEGHACIVAVPDKKDSIRVIAQPLFIPALYDEVLSRPGLFPNGKCADVIHAWTPREGVRKFVVNYQRAASSPAKLVIHLEDNEDFLIASFLGLSVDQLRSVDPTDLAAKLVDGLPHPLRYRGFLRLADGVTVITDRLREFAPFGIPTQLLPPGLDFDLYHPQPADPALRRELGLKDEEKVIVFTGSITFANEPEMRELYLAVALLNQRGVATRLIRTGFNTPSFLQSLAFDHRAFILDLGFIEKARLPRLLALADVLVQPGRLGPFNDYRLPSKLPEFLAVGRPVILPPTNIGAVLEKGRDALFLQSGTPEEIADQCQAVFADPERARKLGDRAVAVARQHFDLRKNTSALVGFYQNVMAAQKPSWWAQLGKAGATDLTLLHEQLLTRIRALASVSPAALAGELTDITRFAEELTQLNRLVESTASGEDRDFLRREAARFRAEAELAGQHARNVQTLLTDKRRHLKLTRQLTGQHIHNLETALDNVRNALSASEGRLLLANKRAADLEVNARDRISELTEKIEVLKSDLRQRDDKVRRIQESFSWQITSPLRMLRRAFVDPFKKKTASAVVAPTAASVSPSVNAPTGTPAAAPAPRRYSYTYNFDHPRSWNTASNKLLILGWCFENEGAAIKGLRARFGNRVIEGIYGSKRLDVLASVGGKKQAEHCGIKLEIKTELGDHPLYVEVLHEDGWNIYFETTVHVGKPGDPSELSEYEKWCEQHETLSPEDLIQIEAHIAKFAAKPLVSVIMPVFNPAESLLRKAIASVKAQLYSNWELCIADDASTEPHVKAVLDEAAAADPRIKLTYREKNGHISLASNTAISLATGDFLALFDHDDVLARTALYEVIAELNAYPSAQFIYTDEDKIDGEDRRFDPYFKPDWNPDLLHGQNYTSHLSVFKRELVAAVGGFRTGFEGSQDWDLTLRIIEKIPESAIRHVPKVLYHWRAVPGSTALQLAEKSYPVDAARKALLEHFERIGQKIELLTVPGDHWRIKYPLPDPPPLVSLIIPTRNGEKLLRQAVTSLLEKTDYPRFEIIIVDNGSDDPATLSYFAEVQTKGVKVLSYPGAFNYSAINNFAVKNASGAVAGLLNNDIEVINRDWLTEMVAQALRPKIGAVGAMLYYPMNTVQHAGVILGLGGVAGHPFKEFPRNDQGQKNRLRLVQNYSAVTAACLVVRKDRYLEVGGLNEVSLKVAFNDVDFCCKLLKAGYRNVWTPYAELYHHESATRGIEDTPEKKARFHSEIDYMMTTWAEYLANDPAYNPNLTLVGEDFSPAYLPRTTKPWSRKTQ